MSFELILAGGAVLAAPGEFTKRAFLNGRIDLTQAEAVIDHLVCENQKRCRSGAGTTVRCAVPEDRSDSPKSYPHARLG